MSDTDSATTDTLAGEHLDQETLLAWSADRLDPPATLRVEAHLEKCELCAAKLDTLSDDNLTSVFAEVEDAILNSKPIEQPKVELPEPSESLAGFGETAYPAGQRWRFSHLIGRGGIGEVWLAKDQLLHKRVAVKTLRREVATDSRVQARFIREARITAQLTHPGTPYVIDLNIDGEKSFYVMGFVEGTTLRKLVARYHSRNRQSSASQTTELTGLIEHFVAVANTIAYAHRLGIIHRDIKSENIVVGDFGQVCVLDWGLAKPIDQPDIAISNPSATPQPGLLSPSDKCLTTMGERIGTPWFMAPEQVRGETETIDHRSDIYSLGALLYEIITGVPPFARSEVGETFKAILNDQPAPFASVGLVGLETLEEICFNALEKKRENRLSSAKAFAEAVATWKTETWTRNFNAKQRERFFDYTNDLIGMLDAEFRLTWLNPSWPRETGWEAEQLAGKSHTELMHPDDSARVARIFEDIQGGGTASEIETRILCRDGSYRYFEWTAAYLPDEDSIYLVGRCTDERRRREISQTDLLNGLPDAMIVVDRDEKIRFVNHRMSRLFGYDHDELQGQPFAILSPSSLRRQIRLLLARLIDSPQQQPIECEHQFVGLRKDGKQFTSTICLSAMSTNEERLFVVTIRRGSQTN